GEAELHAQSSRGSLEPSGASSSGWGEPCSDELRSGESASGASSSRALCSEGAAAACSGGAAAASSADGALAALRSTRAGGGRSLTLERPGRWLLPLFFGSSLRPQSSAMRS